MCGSLPRPEEDARYPGGRVAIVSHLWVLGTEFGSSAIAAMPSVTTVPSHQLPIELFIMDLIYLISLLTMGVSRFFYLS